VRGSGADRSGWGDPRLRARVVSARGPLAVAVAAGLGQTACLVAQAVLLGDLVAQAFRGPEAVGHLAPALVALVGVSALRAGLGVLGPWWGARAAEGVRVGLRRDGLLAALRLGPGWLAEERRGELAVRLGPGLDALDTAVADALPRAVLAVASPLVLLGAIGWLNWLSMVTVVVVLAIVPLFLGLVGRLSAARVRRRSDALGRLGAHFLDVLEGLATLRAFGRAARQEGELARVSDELRRATLSVLRQAFLSGLVLETMAAVGTALVAVPLGLELLDGRALLAPSLAVLVLTPEVFGPIRRASADFHASSEGLAAAKRVLDVVDSADARESGASPAGVGAGLAPTPVAAPAARRTEGLVAQGLTVHRPGRDAPVLREVALALRPGERVALVGPSGAGKSSLLEAVVGLLPPSAGELSLQGVPRAEAPPGWWAAQVAYLPQRPQLFSGSLRDNLELGAPPGGLPEDLVAAAIRVAQLDEVAVALGGWDGPIGEGGARLSAGERQRVALARALCRGSASLVVLDEPTAHLDSATEARLLDALDGWLGERALLVATHRPEVLTLVERVLVVADGQVRPAPVTAELVAAPCAASATTVVAPVGERTVR
jgi:ATP-binding cassette subfamily C protein CydD